MDADAALSALEIPPTLTILQLSSQFLTPQPNTNTRTSDSSDRSSATPAILAADLQHYQELFSKLRFSYVEQVTKERFLRAITSQTPEFVDSAENAALEEKLKADKAALKERKEEVRDMVRSLEEQGRLLAGRYEIVALQTTQLAGLPAEIENLQSTIQTLRTSQPAQSSNPSLALPLQPTLSLLSAREAELDDLDRQIANLQSAIPQRRNEAAALQDEVSILNTKKIKAVEEAKEARRRRENGGMGDELDERGRWLRGVEGGLRGMLEV